MVSLFFTAVVVLYQYDLLWYITFKNTPNLTKVQRQAMLASVTEVVKSIEFAIILVVVARLYKCDITEEELDDMDEQDVRA